MKVEFFFCFKRWELRDLSETLENFMIKFLEMKILKERKAWSFQLLLFDFSE